MSERFWGTGKGYVGRSDVRTDDSFITTEWFTFFWIPIFPRKSYRVWPINFGESKFNVGFRIFPIPFLTFSMTKEYRILEHLPLNRRQVIRGYAITAAVIGMIVFLCLRG